MKYRKYPRTFHFPFSEGVSSDDKIQDNLSLLKDDIVISLKLDGENTNLYNDYIHARSLDSRNHPSRDWVKKFHAEIKHNIPENFRICGENLYAKHSIYYDNLPSYFLVFSIWDGDTCLSWDDTIEYSKLLNLKLVPVIFNGKFEGSVEDFQRFLKESLDTEGNEGYVVRRRDSFSINEFPTSVIKYVRKNHVQTDNHWMSQKIIPNKLKNV
jgi:hypothetical protein